MRIASLAKLGEWSEITRLLEPSAAPTPLSPELAKEYSEALFQVMIKRYYPNDQAPIKKAAEKAALALVNAGANLDRYQRESNSFSFLEEAAKNRFCQLAIAITNKKKAAVTDLKAQAALAQELGEALNNLFYRFSPINEEAKEAALTFIEAGADLKYIRERGYGSILVKAAKKQGFDLLATIVSKEKAAAVTPAEQNALENELGAALYEVVHYSSEVAQKAAFELIKAGANLDYDYPKHSLLKPLLEHGSSELIKTVLTKKKTTANSNEAKATLSKLLGIALINYVERGGTDNIPLLIEYGADVNASDQNDDTALHRAVNKEFFGQDDLKALELLLARGANTTIKNREGNTPIMTAAKLGAWKAVERLLALCKDNTEKTQILFEAIKQSHKDESTPPSSYDKESMEKARLMIDRVLGSGVNLKVVDFLGCTALHLAAEANNFELVNTLLAAGVDPHQKNHLKQTALDLSSNWQIIELLLAVKPTTSWIPSVSSAISKLDYAKVLLRMLSTPVPRENEADVLRVTEKLIAKGASLKNLIDEYDLTDDYFNYFHGNRYRLIKSYPTALHAAAAAGNVTLINFLLSKNPAAANAARKIDRLTVDAPLYKTPVVIAAEMGHWDAVKILMKWSSKDTLASLLIFLAEKAFSPEVQEIANEAITAGANLSYAGLSYSGWSQDIS
ncbi:MAG TPA: hypothetical protein VD770_03770, partial [Coxiellaceae bacterium]|nr:hypothetical protein [Coxiellaceae bacterium]